MPDSEQTKAIHDEIAALEEYCNELVDAIDEFEHQARRCRDRLERAGGESHDAARDLKRLIENRDYNRSELDKSRRRIERLRAGLAES